MKLSIVTTLYCSEAYVDEFWRRSSAVANYVAQNDYEIIFVNDGSPDNSLDCAIRLSEADPHIVVVELSRNFGHHKALMAGLSYARGDYVFLIDSDLEEEPEWLRSFYAQMGRENCDVVFGVQGRRKGGVFERVSGHLFYEVFRILTGLPIARNMVTARLMKRSYTDALLQHSEREFDIGGLFHITGFRQHPHIVVKHSTSQTTYTVRKKLAVLVDSITSFSKVPLVGIFYTGLLTTLVSAAVSVYLVVQHFMYKPISGWTSVIASIWMIGGLIIFFLGVIGIYLSKIYSEVKQRPIAIVRQVYGRIPKESFRGASCPSVYSPDVPKVSKETLERAKPEQGFS